MWSKYLLWHLLALTSYAHLGAATDAKKPNFVFIITDDQDQLLQSMDFMPLVNKYITQEGSYYQKHYCTVAQCCPSRVSLLTGKAAHNTNVTDVVPPYGGYPKFVQESLNDDYLAPWLQAGGYQTYYTGKFLNFHSVQTYNAPFAKGWTGNDFLLDPGTYLYYNATWQKGTDPPRKRPGYNTDYIRDNALGFIDEATAKDQPFFIGVAPIGPHSVTNVLDPERGIINFTPPIPAERHLDLFNDVVVPRTYNWNPDQPSSSDWIAEVAKMNQSQIDYTDSWHRDRLRSLQSVDEMVEAIVVKLENLGLMDNTYIIYTSDNGFHIGQHRLQPGKSCHFEEDINIPFVIRGPGVPKGKVVNTVTTHTDIAPTILDLAGLPLHPEFDGAPMPIKQTRAQCKRQRTEHINVEFWQAGPCGEGRYCTSPAGAQLSFGNGTFKSARIVGKDYGFSYTVWCSGGHELYDMKNDIGQMKNLMKEDQTLPLMGRTIRDVADRLDALLLVLKSCKQDSCREPWKQHHPDGSVSTLKAALNPKYDAYYAKQPKVSYTDCKKGYLIAFEGPQWGGWGGD